MSDCRNQCEEMIELQDTIIDDSIEISKYEKRVAELEAKCATLTEENMKLRCCGNCIHQDDETYECPPLEEVAVIKHCTKWEMGK